MKGGLISWEGLKEYFFSISGNSITDLIAFMSVVVVFFFAKHLWSDHLIGRWRRAIPLSVGGWGTRGKSGTERLKAAIFNALGYGVVSKTTGCEAMFIYTPSCGEPREFFLFRPYDKATIWEQANLLKFSSQFGTEVFIWECMALTPSYVRILQQDWMKDDLATLTNTFPDHEDLQGPAGYNIPEVMTEFISSGGRVITTEESMFPILSEDARRKGGHMKGVGWLEAGMIPDDLLERYPYEEHPFNIALVTAMAAELGFEPDRAVKEMADRVVADLGVLKTYPPVPLEGRHLEFVMGMSANERFGCLGNWTRMGFDQDECLPEKGVWISTVVNNRADRIARSEVFARILVHDVAADRHVLIGTNLAGLTGYIESERETYLEKLFGGEGELPADQLLDILEREGQQLRLPTGTETLKPRLETVLGPLGSSLLGEGEDPTVWMQALEAETPDDKLGRERVDWAKTFCRDYFDYLEIHSELEKKGSTSMKVATLREQLNRWYDAKIVVVNDAMATGDQVNQRVLASTPPGFRNRIMGMQNIKGTGLDFVYRWQAWEQVCRWSEELTGEDEGRSLTAMESLLSFQEFGLLDREFLPEVLDRARERPHAQSESFQAMLNRLASRHEQAQSEDSDEGDAETSKERNPLLIKLLSWIEPLLDSGDAVRRRKKSDQIYKDMAAERIPLDLATVELRKLTKRQKGGWLVG